MEERRSPTVVVLDVADVAVTAGLDWEEEVAFEIQEEVGVQEQTAAVAVDLELAMEAVADRLVPREEGVEGEF